MSRAAVIGYGNVGHHLAKALAKDYRVSVFQRGSNMEEILHSGPHGSNRFDFITLAVTDSQIRPLADALACTDAFGLHTSGSRPLSDLSKHPKRGVIYPLQTFTRSKNSVASPFPLFLETVPELRRELHTFASAISSDIRWMDSSKRLRLHLAAVLTCNFTNHLYHISDKMLKKIGMSFSDVYHLAEETLKKTRELSPGEAQTGPAKRNDEAVMEAHLRLIGNPRWKTIYSLFSEDIRNVNE